MQTKHTFESPRIIVPFDDVSGLVCLLRHGCGLILWRRDRLWPLPISCLAGWRARGCTRGRLWIGRHAVVAAYSLIALLWVYLHDMTRPSFADPPCMPTLCVSSASRERQRTGTSAARDMTIGTGLLRKDMRAAPAQQGHVHIGKQSAEAAHCTAT